MGHFANTLAYYMPKEINTEICIRSLTLVLDICYGFEVFWKPIPPYFSLLSSKAGDTHYSDLAKSILCPSPKSLGPDGHQTQARTRKVTSDIC